MHSPRGIVAFLIGTGIVSFLLGLLNHYLALMPLFFLHLVCSGVFITYAAFHLGHRTGLTAVFLLGLLLDAKSGLPFGSQAILFGTLQTILFRLRERLVSHESDTRMIVAFVANLVIFCFLVLLRPLSGGSGLAVTDLFSLLASQLLLIPLTNWFFSLQNRLLHWMAPGKEEAHLHRAHAAQQKWPTK